MSNKMGVFLCVCATIGIVVFVFGIGWVALEMDMHFKKQIAFYEWELQNRQIEGVLNSVERLVEIIKE